MLKWLKKKKKRYEEYSNTKVILSTNTGSIFAILYSAEAEMFLEKASNVLEKKDLL